MSKSTTLETLLADYDKAAQLYADTEALKPRIEAEINTALAEADALDENAARALQTKRAQLDLVPGKLAQIGRRVDGLTSQIEEQFNLRYRALSQAMREISAASKQTMRARLNDMLADVADPYIVTLLEPLYLITKTCQTISSVENSISHFLVQNDFVKAARTLIENERVIAGLQKINK